MADAGKVAARERELKFDLDPRVVERIANHPLLAAAFVEKRTLISVYFDTPDLALHQARVALRVRDTSAGHVQTIKAEGRELFDRPEWEQALACPEPDLAAAEATGLAPLTDAAVRARLRPLFKTATERTIWHLDRNGSLIELALDLGEVEAGTAHAPIVELELELKRGDPAELFHLARDLAASVPLRLEVKTKAERGYALIAPAPEPAERATPISLDPGMNCGEAFRAVAYNCLRQFVANERAVCAGHAEALHQMRVGLRRLRAAIGAFKELTAGPAQDNIKAELRWIMQSLGPARDLDVFATDVLEPLSATRMSDARFADAYRAFLRRRAKAHASAAGSVRSDRFRGALLDVAAWVEAGPSTIEHGAARERDVRQHAAGLLRRLRKRIREIDEPLGKLAPRQRHKLRIRAKTLRYTIEFFAGLFPGKENLRRRETALRALKNLQDALGALNDLEAWKRLAADGHDLSEEEVRLLSSGDGKADELLRQAQLAHSAFVKVKSFWK
jgi:triphosphatase